MAIVIILAVAGAMAAGLLLIGGGIAHLRDWKTLFSSILKHAILPYPYARATARFLPVVQLAVGIALVVSLIGSTTTSILVPIASASTAALLLAMSVYLTVVVWKRDSATGNCFGSSRSLNWLSVARVVLLAVGPAALSRQGLLNLDHKTTWLSALAGIAIGTCLVFLPQLHRPLERRSVA